MGFNVTANELNKFGNYVYDQVHDDLSRAIEGALEQGLSIEGMGGLLTPTLTDLMQNTFGDLFRDAVGDPLPPKLVNMALTVKSACRHYGEIDQEAEREFDTWQAQIPLPDGPGDSQDNKLYAPYQNESAITEPDEDLPHDWVQKEIDKLGWADGLINWVYEQIRGESLVAEIIEPISAGFPRLHANASAWKHSGRNFAKIADNLHYNSRLLTRKHWQGDAAEAFRTGIAGYWAGLNGIAGVCFVVGEGFEALYKACLAAAKHIVRVVLPQILSLLRKIAAKFAPAVGQLWELIESALNWEVPYLRYVEMVEELVNDVRRTITAIEDVMGMFAAYMGVIESAGSIVGQLADMDPDGVGPSGADVVAMGKTMKQAAEHVTAITGKPERDEKGQYKRDKDGNIILAGGSATHRGVVREAKQAGQKIHQRIDAEVHKRRKNR